MDQTANRDLYPNTADVIRQLRDQLDALGLRGLYACDDTDLQTLARAREQLSDIGAERLAEQLTQLLDAARERNPDAGHQLLRCFSALHLFERLLSREFTQSLSSHTRPS